LTILKFTVNGKGGGMKNIIIVVLLVMGTGYSYGVRPAFDVSAGWEHMTLYAGGSHAGFNFATIQLGTTVPYNRYIGIDAGVAGIFMGEDQTSFIVAGNIGLKEMIPTPYVSPYFNEIITLTSTTSGGSSATNLGLGVGIGVELLSNFYVSPCIGAGFAWQYMNAGGTLNTLDISVGGGIRFSWIK
jgi:hypothetical protein